MQFFARHLKTFIFLYLVCKKQTAHKTKMIFYLGPNFRYEPEIRLVFLSRWLFSECLLSDHDVLKIILVFCQVFQPKSIFVFMVIVIRFINLWKFI